MLTIQRIVSQNIDLFKALRLCALEDSPNAFGSTWEREMSFSDEEWRTRIERWSGETGIGFLAMDGDVPCGIAGALVHASDRSRAELVSVWTAPTHRRKGVGGLLIDAITEWMRSRDISTLVLMVTNTNEPAIRFYTRLGFAMTGRKEPYRNDPALTQFEMIRSATDGTESPGKR